MSEPPPPIYSQQDPDFQSSPLSEDSHGHLDPQLLIIPTVNAVGFQQGYLGADSERASIEGELQIKGQEAGRWYKATASLRTIESAFDREVELSFIEIVVFESSSGRPVPSTLQFSIPLAADAPQSLRTPHSSLSHVLTATLHPSEPGGPSLSKSILVQTKRFTSHSYAPVVHPETRALHDPARVEVQVPRATFIAGEIIPIYVTIPPPSRDLVIERGLRLRNVKAELIQSITVTRLETDGSEEGAFADNGYLNPASDQSSMIPTSPMNEKRSALASSSSNSNFLGSSYRSVVAHSGASCRFHAWKPIRLRFLLHQTSPAGSTDSPMNLPAAESAHLDGDVHFTPITQNTLLHSVTFCLNVHVSFVDTSAHVERVHTISIPVIIIAPPAPLPEVDESLQIAYQKKHDRPPARTVRYDDAESSAPQYEAGPSYLNGLPPPFDERDAPPPFFPHAAESSHNVGLPTFLESEAEIIVPQGEQAQSMLDPLQPTVIAGEGESFGFAASDTFDGYADDGQLAGPPRPALDIAPLDDLNLANIDGQEHSLEALAISLEGRHEGDDDQPPPPPPAMDDPSDPPPSIDSEYRTPRSLPHSPPPHPSVLPRVSISNLNSQSVAPADSEVPAESHAPPPYLRDDGSGGQEHVTRPPPYMDLMPAVRE